MALGLDPGGRARFAKILMAIIDELTQVYRDLLQQHVPASRVFNKVKALKDVFEKLKKDQILILKDASTKGYVDFDITLMYTLLRNICTNIPPPTKGWGISDFPETGEVGLGDDIERIRLIRNKMYGHVSSTSISKQLFEEYWKMVSDICQRFQSRIGGSYTNDLQNIFEGTIDEEQENQYIEKIKADSEKDKSVLEMLSSLQSDTKEIKSRLDIKETKKKSKCSKTTGPYRSAIKVNIRPRINTTKTKRKADKSMDILKRTLNKMVEYINEKTKEGDISKVEDCITQFLEYSSSKGDIVFVEESLESFEKKLRSAFKHQEKVRMAIMKRFFSFVINLREKYKAKFEVNDGCLLITFYFESLQGFEKFTDDLRIGIIQEELRKVVQYDLFLWIFKLKKDDVIVELDEFADIGADDVEIEETRKLAKTCTECHKMTHTTCPECEVGFCEKCWTTHCHVHEFEKIKQQPASAFPVRCTKHEHSTNTKFCKTCNTYMCELCPTESHSLHDTINLIKYQPMEAEMKAGTKGVHVAITNIYESIYLNMKRKREELPKQYKLLKDKIKLEGKKLHEKVDEAVKVHIDMLEDMQIKHWNTLENSIQKMKDALDDVSKMVANYEEILRKGPVQDIETNMESFKIIPQWSDFTLPVFKPRDVEEKVVFEWMGDLIPGDSRVNS
ncbi:uncharacterized protein LOC134267135 [Saccostrea cucullata]|uniref:uncharacterized protein LOC134267135 n=1 Tax=Saccostrea cuccullata TaxID=36930 RepID=UPI002ED0C768